MQKKVIDIFPPRELKKDFHFLGEEKIAEKKKTAKAEGKKGSRLKKSLFLAFLFLISGLLFLHFVLAEVNVEILPETENLNLEEKITVDSTIKQLDLASKVVPGKIFETEKSASQQFSSSGKVVKEKNAQGIIRVYNNYNAPQTLVANTRFQPPLDSVLYFRSTKTVVVPAKNYLDIEVKADRSGNNII